MSPVTAVCGGREASRPAGRKAEHGLLRSLRRKKRNRALHPFESVAASHNDQRILPQLDAFPVPFGVSRNAERSLWPRTEIVTANFALAACPNRKISNTLVENDKGPRLRCGHPPVLARRLRQRSEFRRANGYFAQRWQVEFSQKRRAPIPILNFLNSAVPKLPRRTVRENRSRDYNVRSSRNRSGG